MARHKDILLSFFLSAIQHDLQKVEDQLHKTQSSNLRSLSLLDCYSILTNVLDKYGITLNSRIIEILNQLVLSEVDQGTLLHSSCTLNEQLKTIESRALNIHRQSVDLIKAKILYLQPCFLKELQGALLDRKQAVLSEISVGFWKEFINQHYANILSQREIDCITQEIFPGIIEHIDYHVLA